MEKQGTSKSHSYELKVSSSELLNAIRRWVKTWKVGATPTPKTIFKFNSKGLT